VVGSGVAGLSSAHYLSKQGHDVVVIDNVSASLLSPWNVMVKENIGELMLKAGKLNDPTKVALYEKHFPWVFEFFQEFDIETRSSNIGIVPKGDFPGREVLQRIKSRINATLVQDTIHTIYFNGKGLSGVEGKEHYEGDAFVLAIGGLGNLYQYSTYKLPPYAFHAALFSLGLEYDFLPFNMFHPFLIVDERLPRALISGEILTRLRFVDKEGKEFLSPEIAHALRTNNHHHLFHKMIKEFYRASQQGPIYAEVVQPLDDLKEKEFGWIVKKITMEKFQIHPAFHYSLGGIKGDPYGRTNFNNVFVVGEASTGLHGINRIGGTAVAEGIIFGRLLAEHFSLKERPAPGRPHKLEKIQSHHQQFFWENLGIEIKEKEIPFGGDLRRFAEEIYRENRHYRRE